MLYPSAKNARSLFGLAGGYEGRTCGSQSVTPDGKNGILLATPGGHNILSCSDNMTAGTAHDSPVSENAHGP